MTEPKEVTLVAPGGARMTHRQGDNPIGEREPTTREKQLAAIENAIGALVYASNFEPADTTGLNVSLLKAMTPLRKAQAWLQGECVREEAERRAERIKVGS